MNIECAMHMKVNSILVLRGKLSVHARRHRPDENLTPVKTYLGILSFNFKSAVETHWFKY